MTTTITSATRLDVHYPEGDDPSIQFTLTLDGVVRDLTGVTVELLLKAGPEVANDDATVLDSTGAKVSIADDPTTGIVDVDLDAADVADVRWYVLRVIDGDGRAKTYGYGDLKPINV